MLVIKQMPYFISLQTDKQKEHINKATNNFQYMNGVCGCLKTIQSLGLVTELNTRMTMFQL